MCFYIKINHYFVNDKKIINAQNMYIAQNSGIPYNESRKRAPYPHVKRKEKKNEKKTDQPFTALFYAIERICIYLLRKGSEARGGHRFKNDRGHQSER